jgi:hypothetical protein
MNNETALIKPETQAVASMMDGTGFEHIQRVAKCLSSSGLVPKQFQNNIPNTVIAMEMANRIGASALAVMQSLHVIHEKPGWSSQFVIACLNTCGRFEPLMFELSGTGDAWQCIAWTTAKGDRLPKREDKKAWTIALAKEAGFTVFDGPPVSIGMAKAEGWYGKNGSKWQTLPALMLRYRAASFFCSLFAPELKLGMATAEEVIDVESSSVTISQAQPETRFLPKAATHPTDSPAQAMPEAVAVDSDSVAPATTSEPPAVEPTIQLKVGAYFNDLNVGFDTVMATLRQVAEARWKDCKATQWSELTDKDAADIWKGRIGTGRLAKQAA